MTEEREENKKYEEGLEKLNQGQYNKAIEIFSEVLEDDPEHIAAMNKMGVAFIYLKKTDQAEELFRRAIAIDNRFAAPYSNLGNISLERGELQQAKDYYNKALVFDPEYGPARNNLGIIYKKEGNLGKAVQEFKKAQKSGCFSMNQASGESLLQNKGCMIIFVLLFLIIIIWLIFY